MKKNFVHFNETKYPECVRQAVKEEEVDFFEILLTDLLLFKIECLDRVKLLFLNDICTFP